MTNELRDRLNSTLKNPLQRVGDTDVYGWASRPDEPLCTFLRFFEARLVRVNMDEPNPEEAVRILESTDESQLDRATAENPVAKLTGAGLYIPPPMEILAIIHPSIAKVFFGKGTEFVVPLGYDAIPSYNCEWKNYEHPGDIAYRWRAIVPGSDLNRAPEPAVSRRFHLTKNNVGTKGKKLWLERFAIARKDVADLEAKQGFCEVENFENELAMFRFEDHYTVTQGDVTWVPKPGTVLEWLDVFCTKGAAAAEDARQTDET